MRKISLYSRYYDVKIHVNGNKEIRNGDRKEKCDETRQSQRFRHSHIVIAVLEMRMIFTRTYYLIKRRDKSLSVHNVQCISANSLINYA